SGTRRETRLAGVVDGEPLRVVERVDEVSAELHPLRHGIEVLRQREVRLVAAWQPERRPLRIAVGPVLRGHVRCWIEPERERHRARFWIANLVREQSAAVAVGQLDDAGYRWT